MADAENMKMNEESQINPNNDGIDHINVYSKGKTELGRLLSNFAHTPFNYTEYGNFESVEGFWYYYLTGCKHEKLKYLYGYEAKKYGQTLISDKKKITNLNKEIILGAIRQKIRQNKYIIKELIISNLPFKHYYVYGNTILDLPQYNWIIDELEAIRCYYKSAYNKFKNEKTTNKPRSS